MANTTLSSIGGVLHDSRANELIVMGKAPGTIGKAGDIGGFLSTGVLEIFDVDSTTAELALGIILPMYHTDMDAVIAINKSVEIVIPQAGHLYGVHIDTAQAGACEMGWPLTYHATTGGILDELTNVEDAIVVARYFKVGAGDYFAVVTWVR